jgi:hypothetical protein
MQVQGPLETLDVGNGVGAPLFVIPFDRAGNCLAPESRDQLVHAAAGATDVFLFSHGWNNDWEHATTRYRDFIARYGEERRRRWDPPTRPYQPVLAGVFWLSTALVAPWERAPDIAADAGISDMDEVGVLSEELGSDEAEQLRELAGRTQLDDDQAAELAALLSPLTSGDDEIGAEASPGLATRRRDLVCPGVLLGRHQQPEASITVCSNPARASTAR